MDSWLFEDDFIDYGPLQTYGKKLGVDLRTKNSAEPKGIVKASRDPKSETKKRVTDSVDAVSEARPDKEEHQNQVQAEGRPVEIALSSQQKDALGDYWKQTKSLKRVRKQAIVESDSD